MKKDENNNKDEGIDLSEFIDTNDKPNRKNRKSVEDYKKYDKSTPHTSIKGDKITILSNEEVAIIDDEEKYKLKIKWISGFIKKYNLIDDSLDKITETIKDGKNKLIITYHRIHPKTGERFTTLYLNPKNVVTWTTSKLDEFIEKEKDFHHPNKSISNNNKQLLTIFREYYALDIGELLYTNSTFTVKDFEDKSNIKEQMARKQLNKFEKLGLLISFRYSKGGTKHYKSGLKEEKLREIMNVFF